MISNSSFKVLFTFDSAFYNDFDGLDDKTADEYIDTVISIVKVAFKDKSLKKSIGTTINVIATKNKYDGKM